MFATKAVGNALLAVLLGWATVASPLGAATDGPAPPTKMRCEYLVNPVGIDVRQPRFFWTLEHPERAQKQTAYQILVTTRRELLKQDKANQWDSGKVASEEFSQIVYSGQPLESGKTYYWKVRWWDREGKLSSYSEAATFEMGLLSPEEWKGQWISGIQPPTEEPRKDYWATSLRYSYWDAKNNLLRKEFLLPGKVVRARAHVTTLGYYELRINGEKVGQNVLDPGMSNPAKRILYTTYDVTGLLKQGPNAVGAMLGIGWYVVLPVPAFLLQMNIELEGGKRLTVVSDTTWKAHGGPITQASVYQGEIYDARRELPGWDKPEFDEAGWEPVHPFKAPGGALAAQMMQPIRIMETIPPVKMTNPRPGYHVYDMGRNFAGWVRLRVRGPRGTKVRLRFSQLLWDNGMLDTENLRGARATDDYILRGDGEEVWEPRFTYHGFRYVELTGYPGTPELSTVEGRVVYSSVESVGAFVSSKPILNEIHQMIRRTWTSSIHGVPTACSDRDERVGWADTFLNVEMASLNFDMAAFYANFIRLIRDDQEFGAHMAFGAPMGRAQDIPKPDDPGDPIWGSYYPVFCWHMWQTYGDRRVLEENYEPLKRFVELLRRRATNDLLRINMFNDWVAIEPTEGPFLSSAFYYQDVQILAKTAALLGKTADASVYEGLGKRIKEAINREFWHPEPYLGCDAATNSFNYYANNTQTANALALYLDLPAPGVCRDRLGYVLVWDVVYKHNTHLTAGFVGIKYIIEALRRWGNGAAIAYDLITQTTYPSWGYMLEKGPGTLWEMWQFKGMPGMNSYNLVTLGGPIGQWFYEAPGGIDMGPEGSAYRTITIHPQALRDLEWARASVETIRGKVACSWSISPDGSRLEVDVPVGSLATVQLPSPAEQRWGAYIVREGDRVVWENGQFVPGTPGIKSARSGQLYEVGSGHYKFELVAQ